MAEPAWIPRYLERIGIDDADASVAEIQRAHLRAITYENLDIHLGREIRLDLDHLVAKLVDGGRGGYCFEQNTLLGAALEHLGHDVRHCIGRVRLGDATSPRPTTHMVLLVDDHVVDVGFGAANPLCPLPLDGTATVGGWSWSVEWAPTPEGDEAWHVRQGADALYSFSDAVCHPIDYLAPNHFTATHPSTVFTQHVLAQRADDGAQVSLMGRLLTERHADGRVDMEELSPEEAIDLLDARFGLRLTTQERDRILAVISAR